MNLSLLENYVILIPSLNPDHAMVRLSEDLHETGFRKFIFVDDGSDAECNDIWEELRRQEGVVFIRHAVNLGKGRALKTGINQAMVSFPGCSVVTVDGDGQHLPEDILKCVEEFERIGRNEIVFGVRTFEDKSIPLRSRFGNNLTRAVMRLCGIHLSDTQTGLRVIPSDALARTLGIAGERYEFETNELLIWEEDYHFHEVPIRTIYENNNEVSHFNPIRDSIKIYGSILRYGASSLVATLIDNLVFIFLLPYIGNYWVLTVIGRVCSMLINFTLNRNVVFKSSEKGKGIWIQFVKYVVLVFVSGFISGLAITNLAKLTRLSVIFWKILVETILFFFNYFVQKNWIFRKRKKKC